MGRFMLTVIAAFGEMERELISERTKDGLRQSNKKLGGARTSTRPDAQKPGRPKSAHLDPRRQAIVRLLDTGITDTAKLLACLDPALGTTAGFVRQVKRDHAA